MVALYIEFFTFRALLNLDPNVFCRDRLKALSYRDKRRWERGCANI